MLGERRICESETNQSAGTLMHNSLGDLGYLGHVPEYLEEERFGS